VGRPIETCQFPGDDLKTTYHLAAIRNGQVVGVSTLMKCESDVFPDINTIYQLRGMAVNENYQGHGIGTKMLMFAESFLRKLLIRYLWFNARTSAIEFYKKMGYVVEGEEFFIPEIGPHVKMKKEL
jgi:GNAT superfamily N-acetyltransferase